MAFTKEARRAKIRARVRSTVKGTAERPRLSVFRSNKQIYAQIIDDNQGKTLGKPGASTGVAVRWKAKRYRLHWIKVN